MVGVGMGSGSLGGSICVAPVRPLPVTLVVLSRLLAKPVTLMFLMSAFFTFARKMPFAHVPVMLARVKPSSCLWGWIPVPSTRMGASVT